VRAEKNPAFRRGKLMQRNSRDPLGQLNQNAREGPAAQIFKKKRHRKEKETDDGTVEPRA